jgi:hypothetical protein
VKTNQLRYLVAALCVAAAAPVATAQWSNAALLNDASEAGVECDIVDLAVAGGGGFHAVYRISNGMTYRRYNGTLQPKVPLFTGFMSGAMIAESLNGQVHIVFENWEGSPAPQVGWRMSVNGGGPFSALANLSFTEGCAKFPQITPYGTGTSADMVMSYYRSGKTGGCNSDLYFSRYNGSSWTTEAFLGSKSYSEYDCWGQGWSPLDGSVYRTFDSSGSSMAMRRYTGTWGPATTLVSGSWPVRQHVAINAAGQVMVMWDQDGRIKSRLYTPGNGPGSVIDVCRGGYSGSCDVAWVPGTNKFYMVVGQTDSGAFRVTGRMWAGGTWLPAETVMNGLGDLFLAYPSLAIAANGQMYCAWQYHLPKVQVYYAIRAPQQQQTGTLTGTVVNQNGVPQSSVAVDAIGGEGAVTGADGTYTMQVPAGTYTVVANKVGYTGGSASNVVVTAGGTTTRNFTITAAPPPVTSFEVSDSGNTFNKLTWTNPTGPLFAGTLIRYRTDGQFPSGPADGMLVGDFADQPGSIRTYVHNGLTNGLTYRYRAFAHDSNATPNYATGLDAVGTPAGPGDFDRDGDVDQIDFGHLQQCFSGAFVSQNEPGCQDAWLDADDDVDSEDFAILARCLSGPGVPEEPSCATP